jgi:hypothetical protein
MTAPARTLLTEAEAASQIGVSARTLRNLRAQGMIRYIRPSPRKVFYTPEDCAEYLERQTMQDARPCPSTNPRKVRSSNTTSSSVVVAFTDQLAARRNGTRNGLKRNTVAKPR